MLHIIPVDGGSRIAEARRVALAVAREEGLDDKLAANIAIVSTEICTNLLKHARQGEFFVSPLSKRTGPGIEILAVDRGPGIQDVAACLADGYSSVQTAGTGLGAVSRLSDEFDVYSEPGKGTVLVARMSGSHQPATTVGAVLKPIASEDVSGDDWAVAQQDGIMTLIVADGLGHGVDASRASAEAIATFRQARDLTPLSVLRQIHGALRSTRGAAVAVARIDIEARAVRYAGIGNIAGVVSQTGRATFMVSHAGTAGYQMPRLQEFSYSVPEGAVIVMHSDGLTSTWNLDGYAGLRRAHPSVIAGVLYRDATRHRDDVCVVVAKI
ncbi:MAG: ATP-binding SpoIIE family protein phosphatase [Bryobacteraceae bacterium]